LIILITYKVNKITPVILSGGSGTRLWPLSRQSYPKQFLKFFDENTLFQNTVLRVSDHEIFNQPIILCNNEHRFMVANDLQKINIKPSSIILEPVARNTAPAIVIAALNILKNNKKDDDFMLVMPSDHLIEDVKTFIKNINQAKQATVDGNLVTFGIIPNSPETGYGYIKASEKTNFDNVFKVSKFVEKPDQKTAKNYLKSKEYFWNSGMFFFKASDLLSELEKHSPEILQSCIKSYQNATNDLDFIRLEEDPFAKCANISIDYALMEKSQNIYVVPINVGWSDIGSWQSIASHSKLDENSNSIKGDVKIYDSQNCYINSQNGLVAAIGVEDLIIINLKDVTLVANKNKSQDVKKLFEVLLQEQRQECFNHIKSYRPWGSYEQIDLGKKFKVKRISVKAGASLSLQMHNHRAEHWVVAKGQAHVTNGDQEFILHENQSTYIPTGKKHRLENKTQDILEVIEVQTGDYLGEDDIIRFSDIYGR